MTRTHNYAEFCAYIFKKSKILESCEIRFDLNDKIKMVLYMEIGGYDKCNFIRIGKSQDVIIETFDKFSFVNVYLFVKK